MGESLTQEQLEAAHCWEPSDRVPGRPEMTEFRRRLRYHHAQWREAHGHPIGSQPIAPRPNDQKVRLVGSRIHLDYARQTGANFLTPSGLEAAKTRSSAKEPHQMWDAQRLWADLLASMPLCFNLFGDLAADHELADQAVHAWWPDTPGTVSDIRFAHSPGRFDPDFLGNLNALSVAFILDLGDGSQGVVGLELHYHERIQRERPKPSRLPRYLEITEKSGIFAPGAIEAVNATILLETWLDHLLVLSMLQHPSERWRWGRFVLVHAAGNYDFAAAGARYRDLLLDDSTFATTTIEGILGADVLSRQTTADLRERYIPG